MATTATATPSVPEKKGFFHMLGKLWDAGTTIITVVEKGANSLEDLADTVNLHTEDIYLSTKVELSHSRKELQARLDAS